MRFRHNRLFRFSESRKQFIHNRMVTKCRYRSIVYCFVVLRYRTHTHKFTYSHMCSILQTSQVTYFLKKQYFSTTVDYIRCGWIRITEGMNTCNPYYPCTDRIGCRLKFKLNVIKKKNDLQKNYL